MVARRNIGLIVLAVLIGAVIGSVLAHFLGGLFPAGPVKDFFFKPLQIGIPQLALNLGFLTLNFGFTLAITTFTVIIVILALYLLHRL
jgi:energy-converting hydrogenase Eha subunit E